MTIISMGDDEPMELRQLEIFRALAEELHFTKAAARVHCRAVERNHADTCARE